jgi:hypothetical protein
MKGHFARNFTTHLDGTYTAYTIICSDFLYPAFVHKTCDRQQYADGWEWSKLCWIQFVVRTKTHIISKGDADKKIKSKLNLTMKVLQARLKPKE